MSRTNVIGVSQRQLAKLLGVSHVTVSLALRNDPQIPQETRLRIQNVAQEKGYRPKAILATAMAQMRMGFPRHLRANIAIISFTPDSLTRQFPFSAWIEGSRVRASELGYGIECISVKELLEKKLQNIFKARRIEGAVIVGANHPWCSGLTRVLDRYPFAIVGHMAGDWPRLHQAVGDHYEAGYGLARHLARTEFSKVGVCVQAIVPQMRLKDGICRGFQDSTIHAPVYFHIEDDDLLSEDKFLRWREKEKLDSIITTSPKIMFVLEKHGLRVPEHISLFHWNISDKEKYWSGWDQRNQQLGYAAVDLVIGQIHRGEKGLPQDAKILSFGGHFVQGKTSRAVSSLHSSWRKTYPMIETALQTKWMQLNFKSVQNSNYEQDWTWPLSHFPAGFKHIHGIPFIIVDAESNNGHNCLFLGPKTNHSKIPEEKLHASVSVDERASGIYFLHLAIINDITDKPKTKTAAFYDIQYVSGRMETLELGVCLNNHHRTSRSVLSDWWPNMDAPDFLPHALVAHVLSPHDSDNYKRNLYTLEWINPFPEDPIKVIRLRVPKIPLVSIALFAVTLRTI